MKKKYSLVLTVFLCAVFFSYGQLGPGDIAFVQYNADGTDNFAFVALTDIADTETINFSDNEEDDLTGGEGTIVWTPPSGGITCGTVVVITTTPSASLGTVSETNDLNFAASGDSILAYQGTAASPTFIAALNNDGTTGGVFGGANGTALPAGLTNGTDAVDLVEVDNAAYNGAVLNGTRATILAAINNYNNWTLTSNAVQQTFTGTFTADCTLSTSVEFSSVTYSAGENNASVDLCVNIFDESPTTATNVNVVLTSSNSPHVTYATTTLTFAAGSSTQQCVTVNLSQNTNCGDTTSYIFELQSVTGGNSAGTGTVDQTTLTVNDDDGTFGPFRTISFEAGDDWVYGAGGGTLSSITNKFFGTQSYELGGTNNLTTTNVDISSYTNVTLSVAFAAVGPDSGDDLWMDISYDNGANWFAADRVKLVDGYANANIDIGDTNALNPTTVSSNPYSIAIPATETQIRVRLRAAGLDAGDYYYIDDIILSGDTCITPCTPSHSVSSFVPSSGPVGTEVTITGSGFTNMTEVEFNGIMASVTFIDATTIIAEVPMGATTGEITVTEASCDIVTTDFTVTLNSGNCASLDNLIMTEIYDHASGSLGYIEVYNGTGATINLTNYFIRRYGSNANYVADDYTDYTFTPSITAIADGEVLVGKISSDADVISLPQGPDFSFGNAGFSGINGDDIFELRDNTGVIDVYRVPNGNVGYTALRSVNTGGPNPATPGGNPSDWSHNTTESISDLGNFAYVGLSDFPTVNASPADVTNCASQAVFNATALPGAGGGLTYQWYYNEGDGVSNTWTAVTAGDFPLASSVSGEMTDELTIGDGFVNYNNYQFYCLVTENGTCSTATDAAQIKLDVATWTSSGWSSAPTIDKMAVIDHAYDTAVDGSFQACQLTVNGSYNLDIRNGDFVEVQNDVIVNGSIIIETEGAFVQRNDLATTRGLVTTAGNRDKIQVKKQTAILNSYQEYTYWSSPVIGEMIDNGLNESSDVRRFWYDARNYQDSTMETGNNNATAPGQDDIDDNGDDWQFAASTSVMLPGVGYAATHESLGYVGPARYEYIFEGPFNNGEILVPIYRNDSEMADHNWNFIGNPYPSAVSIVDFLTANTGFIDQNAGTGAITGALFFWSHNAVADAGTNGNEDWNYDAQSDYAIYNGSGGRAGGDGYAPNPFIPSGQGFFVAMDNSSPSSAVSGFPNVRTTNIVFNNGMRVTGNNDQFFRVNSAYENERLWVNLTTDGGLFNQILIAYVDGATDADDGMFYDAFSLSTNVNGMLYSIIDNSDKKYAIQGKSPSSLSTDEVIPLGFYNNIDEATLYTISIPQFEGEFLTENKVYLKDYLLNITHNLSDNDYVFTSEPGAYNDRFELVFIPESLSINENEIDSSELSIVELGDGNIKFSVGQQLQITDVEIFDIVGRTIYQFKGTNSEEVFNLSRLSQSAYLAKVKLSNGQIITKKAIKE